MSRDPRFRPYRVALWTVYLSVVAVAFAVVLTSIVRNLRGPHRPAANPMLPTRAALRVCVTELEALNREQNDRTWRFGDEVGQGDAVARWQAWSRDWEERVDDLADRCRLDVTDQRDGREELARARDAVLSLHRAYRAQVNRFAQEGVDAARSAAKDLHAARDAVTRSP